MSEVEFLEEQAQVEARLRADGGVEPQTVHWRGNLRRVIAVGRQWTDGGSRRVLVELDDGARLELELRGEAGQLAWYVRRHWPAKALA